MRKTIAVTPIEVSLCLLDRIRPYAEFPIILGDNRKVAFVVGQFFLLMDFDVLKTNVQESVGEKNFAHEEMVDKIFPETVEDKQ